MRWIEEKVGEVGKTTREGMPTPYCNHELTRQAVRVSPCASKVCNLAGPHLQERKMPTSCYVLVTSNLNRKLAPSSTSYSLFERLASDQNQNGPHQPPTKAPPLAIPPHPKPRRAFPHNPYKSRIPPLLPPKYPPTHPNRPERPRTSLKFTQQWTSQGG